MNANFARLSSPLLLTLATLLGAAPAQAESKLTGHGFIVRNEASIHAPPMEIWAALIEPSRYWNPQHGYSGNAANFSLEARAGGCFCEMLPNGGSAEHMRVVLVMPGKVLRMSGALGPLQSEGLAGALSWTLTPSGDGGTEIKQVYAVGGQMHFAAETIAPAVDGVLKEQLDRLVALFPHRQP